MSKQPTPPVTGVRIPADLHQKAMSLVGKEFSGMSEYVRHLVRADLERRGLLRAQPQPSTQEVGA